jgi:hypothetical protein
LPDVSQDIPQGISDIQDILRINISQAIISRSFKVFKMFKGLPDVSQDICSGVSDIFQ